MEINKLEHKAWEGKEDKILPQVGNDNRPFSHTSGNEKNNEGPDIAIQAEHQRVDVSFAWEFGQDDSITREEQLHESQRHPRHQRTRHFLEMRLHLWKQTDGPGS